MSLKQRSLLRFVCTYAFVCTGSIREQGCPSLDMRSAPFQSQRPETELGCSGLQCNYLQVQQPAVL